MSVSYEKRIENRDARIASENKENQRKAAMKRPSTPAMPSTCCLIRWLN